MFEIPLNFTFALFSLLILVLPLLVFLYLQVSLIRSSLWALLRMVLQLLLAGFYLEVLFHYDSWWLNALWLVFIFIVASLTMVHRSQLQKKYFILPLFLAFGISTVIGTFILLYFILQIANPWQARYLIPLTGMLAGNSLKATITAIRTFVQEVDSQQMTYRFYSACGATHKETYLPVFQKAMTDATEPILASVATMGIVFLPGFMVGHIIGGQVPTSATFYQAVIMLSFFSNSVLSSLLALLLVSHIRKQQKP